MHLNAGSFCLKLPLAGRTRTRGHTHTHTHTQVSWEPWYAGLVGAGGVKNAASMAIKLSPPMGSMAPRGKEGERVRTERDDPKGNYKDFALVGVELSREGLGYLQHVSKPLYHVSSFTPDSKI